MSQSPSVWQAPEPVGGPAPGIEFASPGARLVAYIVDILVIGAVCFTFSIVGFLIGFLLPIIWVLAAAVVVIVPLAYFPWYWSRGGQTLGHEAHADQGRPRCRRRAGVGGSGDPAAGRLLDLDARVLHRVHLDLHRFAPTRMARSPRRDDRRLVRAFLTFRATV